MHCAHEYIRSPPLLDNIPLYSPPTERKFIRLPPAQDHSSAVVRRQWCGRMMEGTYPQFHASLQRGQTLKRRAGLPGGTVVHCAEERQRGRWFVRPRPTPAAHTVGRCGHLKAGLPRGACTSTRLNPRPLLQDCPGARKCTARTNTRPPTGASLSRSNPETLRSKLALNRYLRCWIWGAAYEV